MIFDTPKPEQSILEDTAMPLAVELQHCSSSIGLLTLRLSQ
jgi:hypothetical protein